jgi:hypothetical protein
MNCQSFFAAIALSSVALGGFASVASAGDVAVPFKGEVERACEFYDVEGGSLVPNDKLFPTMLSSEAGNAGRVTLVCNAPAIVQATGYKPTSETFEVSEAKYTVSNGSETGSEVKVDAGKISIGVNLALISKQAIRPGTYSYDVMVTATP